MSRSDGTVTKSRFARMAGVTPGAISIAVGDGRLLHDDRGRIDPRHPFAVEYLAKHGVRAPGVPEPGRRPRGRPARKAAAKRAGPPPPPPEWEADDGLFGDRVTDRRLIGIDPYADIKRALPEVDIATIQDMPLREIFRRWGSMPSLVEYAKAVKTIEEIQDRRNRNHKFRGVLVARDVVERLFSYVDEAHARMLSDTPARLATLIRGILESDPSQETIEDMIRETLSKDIGAAKTKVQKRLQSMRKDAVDDDTGD